MNEPVPDIELFGQAPAPVITTKRKRPAAPKPMREEIQLRVLSLGAGVQSTAMLLMALAGEFGDRPDAAIFADTGWEPRAVYDHLEWIERTVAPFPVRRVSKGNIRETYSRARTNGSRYVSLPAYVKMPDGSAGMGLRQCTKEFKIEPIQQEVRRLMAERGIQRRRGVVCVEQWIGISLDEVVRMKDSRLSYIRHCWPLVDARMTRQDCLTWLEKHGYPRAPKSACVGCPYHGDAQWRHVRDSDPEAWQEAIEFDRLIRHGGPRGLLIGENYLHRSLVPLDMVDLSTAEENGHMSLWNNECEGMCGV